MGAVVGSVEFDVRAGPVFVGSIEFDVQPTAVFVGAIEFDVLAPAAEEVVAGMGYHHASRSSANTSPPKNAKRYDDDSYRQEQARVAAELADEEIVLAFLMEYALHV